MADGNMANFTDRVRRIQAQHRGEARSAARGGRGHTGGRAARRRIPILGPLLIVLVAVFGVKAVIYNHLGPALYQSRLDGVAASQGSLEKIGAMVMTADPLTIYLASKIKPYMH